MKATVLKLILFLILAFSAVGVKEGDLDTVWTRNAVR